VTRSKRKTSRTIVPIKPVSAAANAPQAILEFIKRRGHSSVADVAAHIGITYEGARQHLTQLETRRLVHKRAAVATSRRASAGRPLASYALTDSGEHLFPKGYDELTVELIDTVAAQLGVPALNQVLGAFAEKRVREWQPRLKGKSLPERVKALQALYAEGDAFMSAEVRRDGIRLIERNCPFLNVAKRRPALCSVTVNTLQHLLGVKVVREERFQSGDGRCVFRVFPEQPIDQRRFRFTLESDTDAAA
jgi:predicted ArsR family transcriptional regulator